MTTLLGDKRVGFESVANGDYLAIRPSGTEEWTIHNITWGGAIELYVSDGDNRFKFGAESTFGGRLGDVFHVTADYFYEIKNVSGGSIYISYDGVLTKA